MARRRWRRRATAVVVVGATATLAWAAGSAADLELAPRILGIRQTAGMQAIGSATLTNTGSSQLTVDRIVATCGAPPAMQLVGGSGGSAFDVPAGSQVPIEVECPAALDPGLHHCTFAALSGSSASAFEAFCQTVVADELVAAPTSVAFADTEVGTSSSVAMVTITNQSTTATVPALELQLDDDAFRIGAPCQDQLGCTLGPIPPQGSASVGVLCRPGSTGMHGGSLVAVGTNGAGLAMPIALSCNATAASRPILALTPSEIVLPEVEVTNKVGVATLELRNAGGSGSLTIDALTIADSGVVGAGADWSVAMGGACTMLPCTLAPGDRAIAKIQFDPSDFNIRPARLIVDYRDPSTRQALVGLVGRGRGATLGVVAPQTLDFGTVRPGATSTALELALDNRGNRATTANLAVSPMTPFSFSTVVTIPPGRTTLSATCSSATEVDATRMLSITSPDAPAMQTRTLHCNVHDAGVFATPSTLQLGELRTGIAVADRAVRVDDTGVTASLPDDPTLAPVTSNLSVSPFDRATTPANSLLSITPTTLGALDEATAIDIVPAGPAQSIAVPISGSVVEATFTAPPIMTLGTFCAGQPTSATPVNFVSSGTATIEISSVELAGGSSSPLELEPVVPTTYPTPLLPHAKATVLVTPRRSSTFGNVTDDLVWDTDAGMPHVVLTAQFIADGGAIAPGAIDFGQVPIRIAVDNDQAVTLQNCSTEQLELVPPDIPTPFEITDRFPTSLAPTDRASFSIAFHPTQVGLVETELVVNTVDGMALRVALRGEGISGSGSNGDDDGTDARTSFYGCGGCAGGDPSGVAMIAFVVMLISARRRTALH